MKKSFTSLAILSALTLGCLLPANAAQAVGPDAKTYQATVDKGIDYLAHSQSEDGSFSRQPMVGVTAIATAALLENGRTVDDPVVAKALKYIDKFVQKDGGIYTVAPGMDFRNYETSIVIMCLSKANTDKRYDKVIHNAQKFLKDLQWTETAEDNKADKSDPNYGGAGYGKSRRPDLSNTAYFIDALKAAGNGPDDEAVKKGFDVCFSLPKLGERKQQSALRGQEPRRRLHLYAR